MKMKSMIDDVNHHLREAMTAVLSEYYNDEKVGYHVDEFARTNDPAEKAEHLRNALDYIKGFADYGEETEG